MVLGKLTIHFQKNEIGFLPKTDTKMNSKWIKDLNVRPQTEQKLHNIGFGSDFLHMIPKAQVTMTSTNIDKLDFMRIIVLCIKRASQVALLVKNPLASAGDIRDLGWKDPRGGGHGNPFQYSCLENHMDREAWWATVHGVPKNQT